MSASGPSGPLVSLSTKIVCAGSNIFDVGNSALDVSRTSNPSIPSLKLYQLGHCTLQNRVVMTFKSQKIIVKQSNICDSVLGLNWLGSLRNFCIASNFH